MLASGLVFGSVLLGLVIVSFLQHRTSGTKQDQQVETARDLPPSGVHSTRAIVARCEGSIAKIEGMLGSGTGFIARPGIIATNSHVINKEMISNLKITFPSAKSNLPSSLSVRLIYEDRPRDLALLKVDTDLTPLDLAYRNAFQRGEDIVIIGNPGGLGGRVSLENAVTRGVLSTEAEFSGQRWYQLSMSVNPGNSGGPVIDTQGRVVGIVTLKAMKEEGHGYCIPVESLVAALRSVDVQTSQNRMNVERRHHSQSIFQVYSELAEMLKDTSALLIMAREPVDGQPVDPKKAEQLFPQAYLAAKDLDSVIRTHYSPALRRIRDDPQLDDETEQDLLRLRQFVDQLREALDQHKQHPISRVTSLYLGVVQELPQLTSRLSGKLGITKPK